MASNPLRGEAELVVGDDTFRLCYDVNAFCMLEGNLKRTTDEIVAEIDNGSVSVTLLRSLLWAGLQKHHDAHLIQAGEILSDAGMAEARTAVMAGLAAAFGVAKEGEKGSRPPRKAKAGTG